MSETDPWKLVADLLQRLKMWELIFDSIYNGAVVTDPDGYITHFNRPYGQFLGVKPEEQIGKHCTEAIENSRMHIVAQTGKAEINRSQHILGQNMVVQRIPIFQDGRLIAVFGQVMFKDVRDVGKLAQNLSLLKSKVELYEKELINLRSTRYNFDSIVGSSPAIRALRREALQATGNDLPVLITGASGTGKELFAQAIHQGSARRIHPFVRINCAAIPRDLLESELFGYEKGAFTGARLSGKPGKIELSHNGTLFLDEIGDLPIEMQPKLLRVLEEKEFERVGSTVLRHANFRLVAATNQDLEKMIAEGRFRSDLFYRLNVISLNIPPLKDRRSDILEIAQHMISQIAAEQALPPISIAADAKQILLEHNWPGNVRELANVLERTMATLDDQIIRAQHLPFYLCQRNHSTRKKNPGTIRSVQQRAEREAILAALNETSHNKARAAALLGIHRTLLYKKMKKYEIDLHPA
ncbi:sigma-54 interaction domain-containing protein [Desulfatirhabdium butyrativorans]|uniref:sigma-54 interaction domain-containing protein n=1 Tax=Desulfatirhabdium butyrativorans TaxID=340467 RepID=UPI0004093559|nr:sigma-54-dependent Fis family transcriptional regulator [Desulfatirhabdium butyrativorans]